MYRYIVLGKTTGCPLNVVEPQWCFKYICVQDYGAPSGTKIVHAPQRDYLDRVTETRVWQTRIQIALRELAFTKRVSKSRYENSRLELAFGKRVGKTRLKNAFGKRV